jgi:hypothetical protein
MLSFVFSPVGQPPVVAPNAKTLICRFFANIQSSMHRRQVLQAVMFSFRSAFRSLSSWHNNHMTGTMVAVGRSIRHMLCRSMQPSPRHAVARELCTCRMLGALHGRLHVTGQTRSAAGGIAVGACVECRCMFNTVTRPDALQRQTSKHRTLIA